jgi:hypothetical protein
MPRGSCIQTSFSPNKKPLAAGGVFDGIAHEAPKNSRAKKTNNLAVFIIFWDDL